MNRINEHKTPSLKQKCIKDVSVIIKRRRQEDIYLSRNCEIPFPVWKYICVFWNVEEGLLQVTTGPLATLWVNSLCVVSVSTFTSRCTRMTCSFIKRNNLLQRAKARTNTKEKWLILPSHIFLSEVGVVPQLMRGVKSHLIHSPLELKPICM